MGSAGRSIQAQSGRCPEGGYKMNPECCGQEMKEIESGFTNELGEYEVVGYKCDKCGFMMDTNGKEIG